MTPISRYYEEWAPYVSAAERRSQAAREVAKLRKKGQSIAPVILSGRAIATTFWGKSWCRNLESYRDYENRLERGRSYARNGAVLDLQLVPLAVTALVSGSSIYTITVSIAALPKAHWRSICRDCASGIDSLVELLRGRFSKPVMERLCQQKTGLFPTPSQITFSCSCPDHASMCKHVAAVLYAVAVRLDEKPELLFLLRAVDEKDLLTHVDTTPLSKMTPSSQKTLAEKDLSALFGLDMECGDVPGETLAEAPTKPRAHGKTVDPLPKKPSKASPEKPLKPAPEPAAVQRPPPKKPTKTAAKHPARRGGAAGKKP